MSLAQDKLFYIQILKDKSEILHVQKKTILMHLRYSIAETS